MIVAIVAAVIVLLFLYLLFPSPRRHPDRRLLQGRYIAHRGLHGLEENTPENSLAAFRAAIQHGYAIEIDIHLTADGEVVVFHDDDTVRMCSVDGKPEEMTLAELKRLRLDDTAETIPTLSECLALVDGQVPLLIEFKCGARTCTALCEKANELLSNYRGAYCIQSFFPLVLRWYRHHRRDICRGQLSSAFPKEELHKQLLGCLLFNFLGRPDFVSYDHRYVSHPCRRLCTWLGAYPVGWTFTSQEAVDRCRTAFGTYIFEGFVPREDE